jgi:hypothetical protein
MTSSIHNVKNSHGKAPVIGVSVLALFTAFLATLPQMIADERELAGYSGQDPAVDAWITAADASLAVAKSACCAVLAAGAASVQGGPSGAADRALVRVAQLFHKVMETTDPEDGARLRAHARLRHWAFLIPRAVPGSRALNHQINTALDALEDWLALEDAFDARAADWADQGPDQDGGCVAAASTPAV